MTSIVVHYKELALKGKNRPWFIQLLVRNLQTRARRARRRGGALGDGPHRDRAAARRAVGRGARAAARACSASPTSRTPAAARTTSTRSPTAILGDLGDRDAASFRVSATRADKRFPFTSPQIEREVGGLIKEATGWHVDLERPGADDPRRDAAGRRVLLLRQGAGRRRPADRHRRPRGVPAVGRHRFAGRGVPDDAPRLLACCSIHFHSYPILSRASQEKVREIAALLTQLPAALAADAGAVRRAAAAGACSASRPSCASSSTGG